ncbi:MAG TPA: cysteine desulfurase family protein [Candidatus Kapabacteria bacterium]|nr:cysteine desulfurase [Ignavibacteria bacterium]HRE58069.1 cysteine desulfurase family protein [Candidatus Kapabacteria bacterium]HRK58644.1 cysteine desulfurase family protein [Candidatus Kapabacteria bacterium]
MQQSTIYLDNNATTPLDERVFNAMKPYFFECYGNAASNTHVFGMTAKKAVEDSRKTIAALIGGKPEEIIFTSGATESDNLAITGAIEASTKTKKHIITCAIEHKAVLDTCAVLEKKGVEVTILPVNTDGVVSLESIEKAITDNTVLVSIMHANNEIGSIQPISDIGKLCKKHGVYFHTDATQGIGKLPFNVEESYVDLASLTAHKIYGPKGIGALYVRNDCKISPLIHGGGHESGMRSGTLNVPGIVGLAKAIEVSVESLQEDAEYTADLRNQLLECLLKYCSTIRINGADPRINPHLRLPNNLNVTLYGDEGELLSGALWNVAYSASSACTSATGKQSHVLSAIGNMGGKDSTTLRFGIGRFTTKAEINSICDSIRDMMS